LDTISIGKHNPRLADVKKAVHNGTLTHDGLLPIEGPKLIHEAHASGVAIAALFVREDVSMDEFPPASSVFTLEKSVFRNLQSTEHSQGVIALVHPKESRLPDILRRGSPIAVLAGLQDPGNVGTILRVAESFEAAGCLALSGTASVHNSKVTRASAGSVFRLPCIWDVVWEDLLSQLASRKIPLVGTSPHAKEAITSWDWNRPVAVLIGNEGSGLTSEQINACTAVLKIPHESRTESLNSALAAAVIFYEAYRTRKQL
jgi:RNA methyltransferase, TrmH family